MNRHGLWCGSAWCGPAWCGLAILLAAMGFAGCDGYDMAGSGTAGAGASAGTGGAAMPGGNTALPGAHTALRDGSFSYTVVSASVLPLGARVALVRAGVSESCILPYHISAFSPVASGTVTTAGSVTLRFSDKRTSPFVEIIYIDSNASGHLDAGDRIWGSNAKDPAGLCFAPQLASRHRVDWDGVAAAIGGSSTYDGVAQDFLVSAGDSQLPAGSLIIGESGYENL